MQRIKQGAASLKSGAIKSGQALKTGTIKAIHTADIFNDSIYLNMKGNKKMTSSLGTVLSIGLIIFILSQGAIQANSMYKREGAQISQVKELENDPDFVYLNETTKFYYGVGISRNGVPVDLSNNGSPFGLTMFFTQTFKDSKGVKSKYKNVVEMAPCNASNFPTSVYGHDVYTMHHLQYAYCPVSVNYILQNGSCPLNVVTKYPTCKTPPSFSIKGIFISSDFEYLQLNVWPCATKYTTTFWKLKCASGNIKQQFSSGEYKVNLYYTNHVVSSQSHDTPDSTYLETLYWVLNPQLAKVADIFADRITVQDYDSLYFGSGYTNSSYYTIQNSNINELNSKQTSAGLQLLQWNIRRSTVNIVMTRIYPTVMDILTNIGGFSQAVIFIAAFAAMGYVEYKYQMTLANELFDFQMPTEKEEEMRKKLKDKNVSEGVKKATDVMKKYLEAKRNNSETRKGLAEDESSGNDTPKSPQKNQKNDPNTSMKEEVVEKYFTEMNLKRQNIDYNLLNYVKTLGRWILRRQSAEDEFAEKARELAEDELNVVRIINKLKEIDKFKVVMMNRYQREVFNFIERPIIKPDKPKPIFLDNLLPDLSFEVEHEQDGGQPDQGNLYARGEYASLAKYPRLYMAYRYLIEQKDDDNGKRSKKLLDMIGDDLLVVFKRVDEIMENEPDPRNFESRIQQIFENMDLPDKDEDEYIK